MTDKPNLQTGHVTPAPSSESVLAAQIFKEVKRAEAWKAMAERLYKSAICDCTEGTGTPCARCLNTIKAYTAIKRYDQ